MKILLIIALVSLYIPKAFGQPSKKNIILYDNANSFRSNKNNVKDDSLYINKIRLNEVFNKKYLIVFQDKVKRKLLKDSLWGYSKGDKVNCRFFKNEIYKILDTTSPIVIYHMNLPQRQTGKINVTRYCYSMGFDGIIKSLSINNLLEDFSSNNTFCKAVRVNFHYNTELVELDECTKQYKILKYFKQ